MASRDASIRVSLNSGAFKSDIRGMESAVKASGMRMGTSLRVPMTAGLNSVKRSIAGLGATLKGTIRTAATLGGAVSLAALIRDSVMLQTKYRNISFLLSRMPGQAMGWQEVQKMVSAAANNTGQEASDMADAFASVYKETGDLVYTKNALETIGKVATTTGRNAAEIANVAVLVKEKWGATDATLQETMARFIEKTDSGGLSLDDLTGRFGAMAGEAAAAGLSGSRGISQLLGIIGQLDDRLGDKATPALSSFLQTIRTGTSQMKRFEKSGGIKFEVDATPLEKVREILASKKMRSMTMQIFTGASGAAFQELTKPFYEKYNEAIAAKKSEKEAIASGLSAYDELTKKIEGTQYSFDKLQKSFEERKATDPSIKIREATNKIRDAFAQPKMIEAIGSLAQSLPILADKLVSIINFIASNPFSAVGLGVGAKVGMSFMGGSVGNILNQSFSELLGGSAKASAALSGVSGASQQLSFGFMDQNKKLEKSFSGLIGKAAVAAGGLAAAGQIGYSIGTLIWEGWLKAQQNKDIDALEKGERAKIGAEGDAKAAKSVDELIKQRKETQKGRADLDNLGLYTHLSGLAASVLSGGEVKTAAIRAITGKKEFTEKENIINREIRQRIEDEIRTPSNTSAALPGGYTETLKKLMPPVDDLSNALNELTKTTRDAARQNRPPSSSRGPAKVSNPSKPGAEPRKG